MDKKTHKINGKVHGNVIDLREARAERDREEREEARRLAKAERPSLRRRMVSLGLILALVLAVAVLTVYWDKINFDAVQRTFSYMGTAQDETGKTQPFPYDGGASASFATLGGNLAFVSNKEAVIYDYSGKLLFQDALQMEAPALDVGGSLAVAYDIGGNTLKVFSEQGVQLELTLEDGEGIYAASLNHADWLAVTAQKRGQKGCVSVYNSNMEKVFDFDSAARFVMDAYVTEDCRYMVAETLGQENGVFASKMIVYRLDSEEQFASFDVTNSLVLGIAAVGSQTVCISDSQAVFASYGGQVVTSYEYPSPYLRAYSAGGDNFLALALNRYRAGASGQIITVNGVGEEIARLDLDEEILDFSAAGRYVAVLYSDRLVIYNKDLSEYGTFAAADTAKAVRMRQDGSAWLISTDTIELLIP